MAKILDIVTNPNDILRKKSTNIKVEDITNKNTQNLFENMTKTMHKKDGIGLAAPQIGKNVRLIVINTKDGALIMCNPIITKKSLIKETDQEGCLSLPGIFGLVKRHKNVSCEYHDKEGEKQKIDAKGLLARVLQHEIDHLDGVLFIDKAKKITED